MNLQCDSERAQRASPLTATWLQRAILTWRRCAFRLYRHLAEPRWQQGRIWQWAYPKWSLPDEAHLVTLRTTDGLQSTTARLVAWRKIGH
jgi:hypothetical protein